MQSPDSHKQSVAAFRCLHPGHRHTFTVHRGRHSIGARPGSEIRLLQGGDLASEVEIEFNGTLMWIRNASDREPARIQASVAGPTAGIPNDGRFYQILPDNILILGGCQFRMNLQQVCETAENTQILESLPEPQLSDSDSTDSVRPVGKPSSPETHLEPPGDAACAVRSVRDVSQSRPKEPDHRANSSGGLFSPQNRQLPVLSTPLKEASDAASPADALHRSSVEPVPLALNVESSCPLRASPKRREECPKITSPGKSSANESPPIQDSPLVNDPIPACRPDGLGAISLSANMSSTTNAAVASLSSPPLRRRNSIAGSQDEEKDDDISPVSPPLGSSDDQYASSMPPEPNPIDQPTSKSILYSKSLESCTPKSTRNRVAITPGTELSSSRRRRRFGLTAPRPMPKLAKERTGAADENHAEISKQSPKDLGHEISAISDGRRENDNELSCPKDEQASEIEHIRDQSTGALDDESAVDRKSSANTSRKRRQVSSGSWHPAESVPKDTEREPKATGDRNADPSTGIRSNWKPVVMFTGIASDDFLNIVSDLGGSVTEEFGMADVLVCDKKIRRTVKFMCGLSTAEAIVTDKWLTDSQKMGVFIEPSAYVIDDKAAERQFGFCLMDSVHAENRQHLLKGKSFWIAPGCNPKPLDFKPIIECSGGSVVDDDPSNLDEDVFVISMPSLEKENRNLQRLGLNIYDKELVLTSILRQAFQTEEFRIFMEPVQPRSKRRKQ